MSYFYQSCDKEATKAFIYEDLKVLGIKIPKLDKIAKAVFVQLQSSSSSTQQVDKKCSTGGKAVFGVPLALMESVEDVNIGYIPQFLVNARHFLSKHLDKEGLFRKTGSVSRQKDLAQQIEENGGEYTEDTQVCDVTSVVKQFFRAMPEPLIPDILQDAFIQAVQLKSSDSKVYSLALLCLLLPSEHLSVLRYTLEILSDVSSNSKVNKMNAYNLSVCLTPNLFHTKQNAKNVDLQTEALQLCIENVINVGVVPPSITEKVVMLRSLEANHAGNGNTSALEKSSTSGLSIRKKKRSGSLQGIVGSIRRSVERMRSKASRRSSSVPDNLNRLSQMEEVTDGDSCLMDLQRGATPQIMKKNLSGETSGFSQQKRKAIMSQSDLLGTPLAKMSIRSNSSDNVFDSPTQNSMMSNNTMMSMNSTRDDDTKLGSPGRKRSWAGLKSPFSKRKRSVSAGPSLSPRRTRTSSNTKKLIRRLSGGRRKTPDMVGQRLAFSNEDDVASVRCRMPSAPPSLSFGADDEKGICNEEFIANLRADLVTSSKTALADTQALEDVESHLARTHTLRQSRRPRAMLRRRAKSADNKVLKRGRPNHPIMGLNRVMLMANNRDTSNSSLFSNITSDGEKKISAPLDTVELPSHVQLLDLPIASQSSCPMDVDNQSEAMLQKRNSRPRSRLMVDEDEQFNSRMAKVASMHEDMFTKPPVPRQQSAGRSTPRSSTFSHGSRKKSQQSLEGRPPKPGQPVYTRKKPSEIENRMSMVSSSSKSSVSSYGSQASVSSSSGSQLCERGSTSAASSKSSLISTDSGISESDTGAGKVKDAIGRRAIEERIVIGGNDSSCSQQTTSETLEQYVTNQPLMVRGAHLQTITHASSISNLQEVSKVKQSKKLFDQPMKRDSQASQPTSDGSVHREPINGEMVFADPINRLSSKPPRQAPVRIPTVFAKNDPRAMRYKMAADAVRRRSLQKENNTKPADKDEQVLCTDFDCSPTLTVETSVTPSAGSLHHSSPPLHRTSSSRGQSPPLRTAGLRQGSQAMPHIPISTDIVRGASSSPLRKILTSSVVNDRPALREHSPNIQRTPVNIPKIKSAMLPLDHITPSNRQSVSRKALRSSVTPQRRHAPYTTATPRSRAVTPQTLKDTAL